MTKSIQLVFIAFAFITVMLSGCAPTPTPVSPTFTPILPTFTSVPPTFTPLPTYTPFPSQTPIPTSLIQYKEDFESGQAKNWKVLFGDWIIVKEGENHFWSGSGPTNYPQAWLRVASFNWSDYAFQSRIRFIKGGIFICVYSINEGSSFYNAYLNSNDDWVSFADYDGTNYQTFGDKSFPIQTDRWYTVRFEVQGEALRLYIDNKLITSGIRNSHQKGGVGYYMGGGDKMDIDDIQIWFLQP